MKAHHNITQIAKLLGRDRSTINRELPRNAAYLGYWVKQASELACKRSESNRNATTIGLLVNEQASALLRLHWCSDQIAGKLPFSHESQYLHFYGDKANGSTLWNDRRCQKQKRKLYASGGYRRGSIPNRISRSGRYTHIYGVSKQVIRNATPSFGPTISEPSSRSRSARAAMGPWPRLQTKRMIWLARPSSKSSIRLRLGSRC